VSMLWEHKAGGPVAQGRTEGRGQGGRGRVYGGRRRWEGLRKGGEGSGGRGREVGGYGRGPEVSVRMPRGGGALCPSHGKTAVPYSTGPRQYSAVLCSGRVRVEDVERRSGSCSPCGSTSCGCFIPSKGADNTRWCVRGMTEHNAMHALSMPTYLTLESTYRTYCIVYPRCIFTPPLSSWLAILRFVSVKAQRGLDACCGRVC